MRQRSLRLVVIVAAVGLAVGALGGVAAAQDTGNSTVDSNTSVTVTDQGGYFHALCIGSLIDHECDKRGELDAGPIAIDYEGFNDDSLADRSARFGDTFVVTIDGEQYTFGFSCEFTTEPPADNPCPVELPQP